ncbi:MAG: hypothetical protein NTV92_09275, partial [Candidatus Bipolaricaulota bacterium]|nr:hypothetical protein [Candidatus Bipolaricaulota bacterium]
RWAMIMTEYTRVQGGATVDELLVISGEPAIGGETGAIKTRIRVYKTAARADKGRVNKTRERIAGAICRSVFGFGMERLESRFDHMLAERPTLARAVRRIYDRTGYNTGVYELGSCEDPHEKGFGMLAAEKSTS